MARQPQVQYINFYTSGSAAYRFDEPIRAKAEVKLPKPRRKKRMVLRVDPVALVGVCVAVVMLVMMISGVSNLVAARREQAQMAQYIQYLQAENERLQAEYAQGYDLDEIYEIATAMGMIPADRAERVQVSVTHVEDTQELSRWESFRIFLAGLFA